MFDLLRKFRTPLVAGGLVLVALLVYSANLRQRERTTFFERAVLQVTAPFQKGIDVALTAATDSWDRYFWLVGTGEENRHLHEENRRLRSELYALEEVRLTNERLRKLLLFKEEMELPAIPAQIIAEDASSWFRTVVIDKGSSHGVREGMPVVVAEGAVGRVITVASGQSRVLLITDASSAVASLVQRNRTRGIIRGRGESLNMEYALREADVRIGDVIITSGTGGVFPKGLPVGRVTGVAREAYGLFQGIEVEPYVDFARLEEVLVLLRDDP
jgi:rod shape-determining protein MreC